MKLIGERYQLVEKLGQGGMGEVYRGVDTRTDTPVAIKNLHSGISIDSAILERFRREGAALRELNHPNIVKMLDMIQHEGHYYLVMEYIDGGDLSDLLKAEGRLPLNKAIRIALELADALSRAHHLGIIHRDIKPANVLIARDGTPRLTDFGVAHIESEERLTGTGVAVGTLDYMPPEAVNGEPVDARGDIWALGVMLYEMLTGERPFKGDTTMMLLTAILTQPVPEIAPHLPDMPASLQDLIEQMLQKNRDERLRSMRQIGAALEAILHGEPVNLRRLDTPSTPRVTQMQVESEPATEPRVVSSPESRKMPVWLVPVVTVLFVFIGAALVASGGTRPPITPTPEPTSTPVPTIIEMDAPAPEGYQWVNVAEARLLMPVGWNALDSEAFLNLTRETFVNAGLESNFDQSMEFMDQQRAFTAFVNWLEIKGGALMIEDTGLIISPEVQAARIQEMSALSTFSFSEPETIMLPAGSALRFVSTVNLGNLSMQMNIFAFQRDSTQYTLILSGRKDSMDTLQPVIDIVINSFHIVESAIPTPLPGALVLGSQPEATLEVTAEITTEATPEVIAPAIIPEGWKAVQGDGFSLAIPENWLSLPPNDELAETSIMLFAPADNKERYLELVRVLLEAFEVKILVGRIGAVPIAGGVSIIDTSLEVNADFMEAMLTSMFSEFGGEMQISDGIVLPAGTSRLLQVELPNAAFETAGKGLFYIIDTLQGFYVLTFTTTKALYSEQEPIFDQIAHSFRVTP